MADQYPDTRLVRDLALFAQSQIEGLDTYNESRVWSYAAEANAEQTARLGLATFRGMGLIRGDVRAGMPDEIAQDSDPLSDEDHFAVGLLADQARSMVMAGGEHSAGWVNSQATRAVAARTGELTVRVAKKLSGVESIKPRAFVHSLSGVLTGRDIAIQPVVMEQIEVQWNRDDLQQEAAI